MLPKLVDLPYRSTFLLSARLGFTKASVILRMLLRCTHVHYGIFQSLFVVGPGYPFTVQSTLELAAFIIQSFGFISDGLKLFFQRLVFELPITLRY